ncbi:hypothetical protein DL89DRAFT_89682 [Linderina pennispora]|uniref:Spc7 kinetochore protein domain-containing protein n=1 Tax=Linderina pennispora TaxID=61395 RepID=A0A1Y1WIZ7_9FUNG|nr:uncharacterized protein DL89DRAFT_89682 [Linderina pennispora]ORX73196.1 hypothetical protein DL89DRAFT_89682 [Linderina pennispora]
MNPSSDADAIDQGSTPKRLKTNDHKAVPASILMASPSEAHAEQKPPTLSPKDRRKGRKSLGRRVSFAPTAHVRMFEIQEEKQAQTPPANMFDIPDLSSQAGTGGFDLGGLSAIEETSMVSNESFDISVHQSDLTDSSLGDSSFLANLQAPVDNAAQYQEVLSDDDEDLEDDDEEAQTMELTGTFDMGAIQNGADSPEEDVEEEDGVQSTHSLASGLATTDVSSFLNMLLQGNGTSATPAGALAAQEPSLLDNIISQFDTTQQISVLAGQGNITDSETTRVGIDEGSADEDTIRVQPAGDSSDEDIDDEGDEGAVTMELTGIVGDLEPGQNSSMIVTEEDSDAEMEIEGETPVVDGDADTEPEDEGAELVADDNADSGPEEAEDSVDEETAESDEEEVAEPIAEATNAAESVSLQATDAAESIARETAPEPAEDAAGPPSPSLSASLQASSPTLPPTRTSPRTPRTPKAPKVAATPKMPMTAATPSTRATPKAATPAPASISRSSRNGPSAIPKTAATLPRPVATPKFGPLPKGPATAPRATAVEPLFPPKSAAPPTNASAAEAAMSPVLGMQTPRTMATPGANGGVSVAGVASHSLFDASPSVEASNRRDSRSRKSPNEKPPALLFDIHQQQPEPMGGDETIPAPKEPTPEPVRDPMFSLDPLPPVPTLDGTPELITSKVSPALGDIAKAGLVFGIFNAYQRQNLVPTAPAPDLDMEYPQKYEPLYRKAKLKARLDYCLSLNNLFEIDREVSEVIKQPSADVTPFAEFFQEQNALLEEHRSNLLLKLSRLKQKLSQPAPSESTGRRAADIKALRSQVSELRATRTAKVAAVDELNTEIQALQRTSLALDRKASEKKNSQSVLLAINGLHLSDVSEDRCEFVYDKFAKLNVDATAEFSSLHPDIDWNAVVKDAVGGKEMASRHYVIKAMKANAVIKRLLADVKAIRRQTLVELQYSEGIQVRVLFFSRAHRRRFYLQIPLPKLDDYVHLYEESRFGLASRCHVWRCGCCPV